MPRRGVVRACRFGRTRRRDALRCSFHLPLAHASAERGQNFMNAAIPVIIHCFHQTQADAEPDGHWHRFARQNCSMFLPEDHQPARPCGLSTALNYVMITLNGPSGATPAADHRYRPVNLRFSRFRVANRRHFPRGAGQRSIDGLRRRNRHALRKSGRAVRASATSNTGGRVRFGAAIKTVKPPVTPSQITPAN